MGSLKAGVSRLKKKPNLKAVLKIYLQKKFDNTRH